MIQNEGLSQYLYRMLVYTSDGMLCWAADADNGTDAQGSDGGDL